jgi:hypothetical protein
MAASVPMHIPALSGWERVLALREKALKVRIQYIVAFALIGCLGFMAYGFIGLGKFIEIFVPWHIVQP